MIGSFKRLPENRHAKQLVRYGLVGLSTNLALYAFYLLITYLGTEPKMAMTIAYIVGAILGFVGHRTWTFMHKGALLGSSIRYIVAQVSGYLINFVILLAFVDKLGYPHQWVQAVAIFVVAGFLFVAFRHFVFPADRSAFGVDE